MGGSNGFKVPSLCKWEVRNETEEDLKIEIDSRGEKTVTAGGSSSWSKGLGDMVTVYVRNLGGTELTSRKYDATGNGSCAVQKHGDKYHI
mmetsp:Transcript_2050/g.4533  ORF Transcript_2050/g.4533 Transcript_2050/m.4533 type:complete len:90 (-) Transcript_2050:741-1010(-)